MSKSAPQAPYRDSTDLPRPPPSYEPSSPPAGASSGDPLLGADPSRHSEDDIPDDFKYHPSRSVLEWLVDWIDMASV